MKKCILFVLSVLFLSCDSASDLVYSERTTAENRDKFSRNLISVTIKEAIRKPLNNETEKDWQGAFWAMGLSGYKSDTCLIAIKSVADDFGNRSLSFQRAWLEVVYTLYQTEFFSEVEFILNNTTNPKIFAMSALYILRIKNHDKARNIITELMKMRFQDWTDEPILYMLYQKLSAKTEETPPLTDMFINKNISGKPVFFSLQRSDRRYPGLVIIRKADGTFLRDNHGNIIGIPQLALASSGLPGYLTNGNTPQGILSVQGTERSENVFIGPSFNMQLVLPFETDAITYFHQTKDPAEQWSIELYRDLLPESWQNYLPVYETWYAGKAGRSEIIAHGTTINPEFYKNKSYYPFTPSLGCLTTLELWSAADGARIYSDQQKLINMFQTVGGRDGFFVVIDINNKKCPVTMQEIISEILAAEDKNHQN